MKKQNYIVRVSKLSKYFGETSETFKNGLIHEEEYNYEYSDYSLALSDYNKKCAECAEQCATGIVFTQSYTIQLLSAEGTNPMKGHSEKRRVCFQLIISNL